VAQTALDWDGQGWEAHCLTLLRLRYRVPGEFEHVPASDQGDLGIEGFSHDGCVYQCYAPQGPLTISARYERQRDKLTEDLGKLENHQAELLAIMGGTSIHVYVFMTPIHDSRRLNSHAKMKAAEIRSKGMPHCALDFDVVIHTEADYLAECAELISLGLTKRHLTPVSLPARAVQQYVGLNPSLIATIDGKLARLRGISDDEKTSLRTALLTRKLSADNKLDEIRGLDAMAWERLQELRATKEKSLEIECLLSQVEPQVLLNETSASYRGTLKEGLTFLTDSDALDIAWGTTTDWLAECPLDFREPQAS